MDEFTGILERGADIMESVRPTGQPDVGAADDDVSIQFESAEEAQVIYDLLVGTTTGVKLLMPGEVMLRVVEGWNQASLNFAPHVRYLKPEILVAVLDSIRENVTEEEMEEADKVIGEDLAAIVEFNTWHASDDGKFSSKEALKRAKKGSYSDGKRKNKVSGKGKGKALKLVATSHPCGRAARDSGGNKRCWDGQKVDWTGSAVARVIKKAKKAGRVEGALTPDDLIILERVARVLNARAEIMEKNDDATSMRKMFFALASAVQDKRENGIRQCKEDLKNAGADEKDVSFVLKTGKIPKSVKDWESMDESAFQKMRTGMDKKAKVPPGYKMVFGKLVKIKGANPQAMRNAQQRSREMAKKYKSEDLDEAKQDKKKAAEISKIYSKYFERISVNMMDLGKVRREIEALMDKGADFDKEMPGIVKKYRAEDVEKRSVRDLLDEIKKSRSFTVKVRCKRPDCGHHWTEKIDDKTPKDEDGNPVLKCPACDRRADVDVMEGVDEGLAEETKSGLIKGADELKVGDVVFSMLAHQWVKISKVSQKSVSYVGSVKPDTLPQKHVFGSFNNLFWDNKGHPSENTKEDAIGLREDADGSVSGILNDLEEEAGSEESVWMAISFGNFGAMHGELIFPATAETVSKADAKKEYERLSQQIMRSGGSRAQQGVALVKFEEPVRGLDRKGEKGNVRDFLKKHDGLIDSTTGASLKGYGGESR